MDDKDYDTGEQKDYEDGQKEGSQANALGRILGPGFVSDAYQAGFNNGADNPAKNDD